MRGDPKITKAVVNRDSMVLRMPAHMVQCEWQICTGSVTQTGRHAETRKRVDIYKSASVACARATDAGQTVCDTGRQAGRQNAETRKRVDIYKSVGLEFAL